MLKYNYPPAPPEVSKIADFFAPKMFVVSLLYLVIIGIILHWWNHDPILDEFERQITWQILLVLWIPFWFELLIAVFTAPNHDRKYKRIAMIALIPAARLAVSPHVYPEWVWLPRLGWQKRSRQLTRFLERKLALPMLGVTLMILPVLGIEFFLSEWIQQNPWMQLLLDISVVFIWIAFATELIIMLTISRDRWLYLKTHWVNALIVLLPTLAFLRSLRIIKLAQLAGATKLLKVYRLRSVFFRLYESLLTLSIIERLLRRKPEQMRDNLLYQIERTEYELNELKSRLADLEKKYHFDEDKDQ